MDTQVLDTFASAPPATASEPLSDGFGGSKHWITKENARELSARSWQKRKQHEKELLEAAKRDKEATPQSIQLAKQLAQIEYLMDGEKDPDALVKLSSAHSRLFSAWQVLTGTPNPGSRRSSKRPDRPIAVAPIAPEAPVDPSPQ